MRVQFLLLAMTGWVSTAQAACPTAQDLKVDNNPAFLRSVRMDKSCDVKTIYKCAGGTLIVSGYDNSDSTKVVGVECINNQDPRAIRQQKMDAAGLLVPEQDIVRKAREKQMPEALLKKALENYQKLKKAGKTDQPCFAVQDLTVGGAPSNWVVCMKPGLDVRRSDGELVNAEEKCVNHPFQNNGCRRFYGNRPGYCLPVGGSYVTGGMKGDKNQAASAMSLKGQDDANANVNMKWTAKGESLPEGTAVYVYPSREDLQSYNQSKSSAYWDQGCSAAIKKVGWYGTDGSFGPTLDEVMKGTKAPALQKTIAPASGSR